MDAAAASPCHSCGAPVSKDELVQGLAVRIDGNLVCPLCVDGLPGEAQVKINRVRALRGLNAVTYRVERLRHPRLAAYTFTTAGNLNVHRRDLAASGRFEAPLLPPPSERPPAPTPAMAPGPAAAARGRSRGRLVAIAGVAVVGLGIGLAFSVNGGTPTATGTPATAPIAPTAERPAKRRLDYASGALRAWDEAAADPDCPAEVREAIAAEVIAERTRALDDAERALKQGDRERATAALTGDDPPPHVLFANLRLRGERLAKRIAEPAAPMPPEPPVVAPPQPMPPPVLRPAPIPPPPVVAKAVVAATPASADCLLIKAADLGETAGRDEWKGRTTRSLSGDSGSLARTLALAGGRYQVWVRARGGDIAGSVQVVLGALRTAPIAVAPAKTATWQRIATEVELPPGPCRLQVVALGLGASITELYLAGSDLPEPERGGDSAGAPTWLPDQAPPPTDPAKLTSHAGAWSPRFAGVHAVLDPLDPASRVPPGLPGNGGAIHESSAKGRKKQGFTLDLTGVDLTGGGLALLIHPVRPDRIQLVITLIDADDRRQVLPPMPVDAGRWNTLLVPATAATGQVDADRLKALMIEDVAALTTSFLLAKVAVSRGEPPSETALDLRAPALLPLAYADLDRALTAVAAKRKSRNWRRDFDPAALKVLIGHQLLMGGWDTMARKGLAEVLKEPLKNDELPMRTLQEFVMHDAWLDALFEPPADQPAVLDPAKHHLVILCTAGVEFPIGLNEPQAFLNLWIRLIDKCIERGVLPVTVLGPNKVNASDIAEVEQLWIHVEAWLRKNRPGLPIIDLRSAKAVSYQRFAPGMAQLSVQLLVDGYGELYRRILALKKAK